MKTKLKITAKLEDVLVDFDGPQLVLLISAKRPIIGMAIDSFSNFSNPFFCCAVKDRSFEKYFNGTADLNYVFSTAFRKKYYFADLDEDEEKVSLKVATRSDLENQNIWPEIGFFSNCHNSEYGKDKRFTATQTFHIDGRWGANDFATFNNKVADLYAICDVVSPANDNHDDDRLKQSIQRNEFSSGGSYLSFYNGLKNTSNQLQIQELRYASPGIISMRGNRAAFEEISDILSRFEVNYDYLKTLNKRLSDILKKDDLLSADSDKRFSTKQAELLAFDQARELYVELGFDNSNWLMKHCGNNILVFCKIVRSIFVRASRIWKYKIEGRLQEINFSEN